MTPILSKTPAKSTLPAPLSGISRRKAIALAALAIGGLAWLARPKAAVRNSPARGNSIAMIGDSMTRGAGASKGRALPDLLAERLGAPVANYGEDGDTTEDALRRLPYILAHSPDVAIVFLGGNDRLRSRSLEETERDLGEIARRCVESGALTVLVGFSAVPGDGYASMYKRLARRHGCLLVPGALDGILFNPRFKDDPIHPNDAGYALIAERIAIRLRPHLR